MPSASLPNTSPRILIGQGMSFEERQNELRMRKAKRNLKHSCAVRMGQRVYTKHRYGGLTGAAYYKQEPNLRARIITSTDYICVHAQIGIYTTAITGRRALPKGGKRHKICTTRAIR
jgi:hypothetical protein